MWTGACPSSQRRSGSSSWELGRRRDGSGSRFLTGVCCAVPRPQLASSLWVLLMISKNDSSILCALRRVRVAAVVARVRVAAVVARVRVAAVKALVSKKGGKLQRCRKKAKSRVGSAALTVHAVRCQKNCPKTLENDPGENHAMPKGRAVPHGNGLGICFAYTQHCSPC